MKTILSSIAILFSTVIIAQVTSEIRPVGDFTGIRTSSVIKIEITQGETCSVTVEGSANDIKQVNTEVKDGILSITSGASDIEDDSKVIVTVKNLRSIDLSGASNTSSTNKIVSDSLRIIGSGASSLKLDVQTDYLKSILSGASNLKISGNTKNLDAVLTGASQMKGYSLIAERATITTSGAASAHLNTTTALIATTSGASEVHYQGNPSEKNVNSSGASSVVMKDDAKSDTTNIRMGKYDVHVTEADVDDDERSKREKHADDNDFEFWEGLDFGVNGLLTQDNKIDLPAGFDFLELNYAKSYFFSWNFFQKNIHIYRNNVNLGTGLGMSWNHYNFRNSYTLTPNVPYQTAIYDSVNHFTRNRLGITYLNVPLFLEFNTNNSDAKNSFHIAGGMEFGYNVFSNILKQRYEMDGHKIKTKQKDDFNVNPFSMDAIARIGYGNFTIFGKYSLTTLFEKDKGPVVYPFTAGINLSF